MSLYYEPLPFFSPLQHLACCCTSSPNPTSPLIIPFPYLTSRLQIVYDTNEQVLTYGTTPTILHCNKFSSSYYKPLSPRMRLILIAFSRNSSYPIATYQCYCLPFLHSDKVSAVFFHFPPLSLLNEILPLFLLKPSSILLCFLSTIRRLLCS